MEEREGGESSDDDGDVAQTVERTIREQDDGRRQAEEGHASLMMKSAFFYADDGVVASTDPGCLQSEFDTLTGIFGRVRQQTNVRKTVGVLYRLCRAAEVRADEAYIRRMTGEGLIFKEGQL